ncbi:MAG: T9SS type A sorting domain-containing protein [Bacteroidota bacterium]
MDQLQPNKGRIDVLGREIAVLVNEYKQAGSYRTQFDASTLPSGMYIYRLQHNGNTLQRRLISLK